MPVYNGSKYLERSIGSVVCQTYTDWELIVLDDESQDDSMTVLQAFAARDSRIRVLTKKNDGRGNTARNMALMDKEASGEFYFYMSQDDRIAPDLFEKAVRRADAESLDIVVPDMLLEYADGSTRSVKGSYPPDGDYSSVLSGMDAFYRSIDFSINGFALISRRLVDYGVQDDEHYDSDEYNTRLQFLAAERVGFCRSVFYYYQGNEEAMTKRFSVRWFQRLDTARMLDSVSTRVFSGSGRISKAKSWLMDVYISLSVTYLREAPNLSAAQCFEAERRFADFEKSVSFSGCRFSVLRRLSPLGRCFAVWYFVFGTCRNMGWLFRLYKSLF